MTTKWSALSLVIIAFFLWVVTQWGMVDAPTVETGNGLRNAVVSVVWSLRYAIGLALAILLYPFDITRHTPLSSHAKTWSQRLHRVFYAGLVGVLGLGLIAIIAPPITLLKTLNWHDPALAVRQALQSINVSRLVLVLVLIWVDAIVFRLSWQLGDRMWQREADTWIAFAAIAAFQASLASWIYVRSWFWAILAVISLPTWGFLVVLLQQLYLSRSRSAILIVSAFAVHMLLAWVLLEYLPGIWYLISIVLAVIFTIATLILGVRYSFRQGFLTETYSRYRLRPRPFDSRVIIDILRAELSALPLGRILQRVLVPIARVGLYVSKVVMTFAVYLANLVVYAGLSAINLMVRVPEVVGAGIFRLYRLASFYIQYFLFPTLAYASAGIALVWLTLTWTHYYASPIVGQFLAMVLAAVAAVLGIATGLALLFDIAPSLSLGVYLKLDEFDEDDRNFWKTPLGYVMISMLCLFALQTIVWLTFIILDAGGWLLEENVLDQAIDLVRPGPFYFFVATILVVAIIIIVGATALRSSTVQRSQSPPKKS